MNTLTALLALPSQIAANSTTGDGLNQLKRHSACVTTTVGDQKTKYATLANARILSVRRLPAVCGLSTSAGRRLVRTDGRRRSVA